MDTTLRNRISSLVWKYEIRGNKSELNHCLGDLQEHTNKKLNEAVKRSIFNTNFRFQVMKYKIKELVHTIHHPDQSP